MRVLEGIAGRRPTALEEAYQVFRLERQGNLVAPRTLEFYDRRVGELIAWLRSEAPYGRARRGRWRQSPACLSRVHDRAATSGRAAACRPRLSMRRTARFTRSSHGRSSTATASTGGCSGCRRRAGRTRRRRSSM